MSVRKDVDWERIREEYRANQLSLREIAARHDIVASMISRRAKKEKWQRDLAGRVNRETRERLLCDEPLTPEQQQQQHEQRTEETVERCVARNVELVTTHRKDLQQLNALKRILATRLTAHLNGETPDGPFMGDKESPADVLEKLARVTSRLIPLERQAFNLDDVGSGSEHEKWLNQLAEAGI